MKVTEVACIQGAWTPIPETANNVLDIGSGTGLLSLMLAQRFPTININTIEIDEGSFKQGRENIFVSPFASRINCHHQDFLSFQPEKKYDFIICNPPFFENQLASPKEEKNVAWHSSKLTLSALLKKSIELLSPLGNISLLFPISRLDDLKRETKSKGLRFKHILFIKHTAEKDVSFFIAILSQKNTTEPVEEVLILKEKNEYTEMMKSLMQGFYLHV